MDKHQMKQMYDDIAVPKKALKKAIHQAVVRAENESNTRRRFKWARTITNGMAILCCGMYIVFIIWSFSSLCKQSDGEHTHCRTNL